MTPAERAAIEREITDRSAYLNRVHAQGPEHAMRRRRGQGWIVIAWDGTTVPTSFKRKKDAVAYTQQHVAECSRKAGELRAILEGAALDAEIALTTPEERLASSRAQVAAIDGPRWRKSA
jgi:hypothetical protein